MDGDRQYDGLFFNMIRPQEDTKTSNMGVVGWVRRALTEK